MKYSNTYEGIFISRPNRFIAMVEINGREETVHVKNTGRCKELLLPGVRVALQKSSNTNRKTAYDLIAVYKKNLGWVNIDSQAPNTVMKEWLKKQDYDLIKPEYQYGNSRIDFYMKKDAEKWLVEVKGCTLEIDGVGYFPDAPTERGVKHIKELAAAHESGYHTAIAFVIAMNGIYEVRPNMDTHPEFGEALKESQNIGVEVWFMQCNVEADSLEITGRCN